MLRLRVHAGREPVCRNWLREPRLFPSLVDNGSAGRPRDRRQSVYWRHKHQSTKMALVTAAHHSAFTNGVMETSVGHGPTGADEAYLPVRANVTRGPADSYVTSKTVVVVTAKKMIITRRSTRAMTFTSQDVTRNVWRIGVSVPPLVVSFPSGVECRTVING